MEEKTIKEWFLDTTWGRVAMISWGESHRPPILMAHGHMDSAATFIPLIQHLPDTYYYVSFDFLGHGKSDHVYSGPAISQSFMVEILRRIVKHMQWKSFVYLDHSMGFMTGLLYQHVYPGHIKTMINLDPILPIGQYGYLTHYFEKWYSYFYDYYYERYQGAQKPSRLTSYEHVVNSVMETRRLTREQAEIVLSRSLVPAENGLYRLTTQSTMRGIVQHPAYEDLLHYILKTSTTPMLNIYASETTYDIGEDDFGMKLMSVLDESSLHRSVHVKGNHDVHITNPELLVPHILKFLVRNDNVKSKL